MYFNTRSLGGNGSVLHVHVAVVTLRARIRGPVQAVLNVHNVISRREREWSGTDDANQAAVKFEEIDG